MFNNHNCVMYDQLNVKLFATIFLVFSLGVIFYSTDEAYAAKNIDFDQHPYFIGHSGGITFWDSTYVGNGIVDEVDLRLYAPCYTGPIIIRLNEIAVLDNGFTYSQKINIEEDFLCSIFPSTPPSTPVDDTFSLKVKVGQNLIVKPLTKNFPRDVAHVEKTNDGISWANVIPVTTVADCTVDNGLDDDNDGLCDTWEVSGGLDITHAGISGVANYTFLEPNCDFFTSHSSGIACSDNLVKDIYIEIDQMSGHPASLDAIAEVKEAFLNAPTPIRLHIQVDPETPPHKDAIAWEGTNISTGFGFPQIKMHYFGTVTEKNDPNWTPIHWMQKMQAFHYTLYAHTLMGFPDTSGKAELRGNDILITFGGWPNGLPSEKYESATLMHELGHNLGLHHGGNYTDSINCKPQYPSIMSYHLQFPPPGYSERPLDYSRKNLGFLDESNLNETAGLPSYKINPTDSEVKIMFGPDFPLVPSITGNVPINWNQTNGIDTVLVHADLNDIPSIGCDNPGYDQYSGHDDWTNLELNSTGTATWLDGRSIGPNQSFNNVNGFAPLGRSVDSISEMNYENVQLLHELSVEGLRQVIDNLNSNNFTSSSDAYKYKEQYNKELEKIKFLIIVDRYDESIKQLQNIQKTFDGEGDNDRISFETANKIGLVSATRDIIDAQNIVTDITYNSKHPDPRLYEFYIIIAFIIIIIAIGFGCIYFVSRRLRSRSTSRKQKDLN